MSALKVLSSRTQIRYVSSAEKSWPTGVMDTHIGYVLVVPWTPLKKLSPICMRVNDMECTVCHKPIAGFEIFGKTGFEMCFDHWIDCMIADVAESSGKDSWYGLGPHVHSYDDNGNILIGGTRFMTLPEPNADGYIIIDGLLFIPDPDAPGLGIWRVRHGG